MLERLYIKNVALIDEISVEFGEGLNILSGETGAGKSIIIDSINFPAPVSPLKILILFWAKRLIKILYTEAQIKPM